MKSLLALAWLAAASAQLLTDNTFYLLCYKMDLKCQAA